MLLIVRKGRGSNTRHSAYWANVSKFLKEMSIKECKHFNLFQHPTKHILISKEVKCRPHIKVYRVLYNIYEHILII